MQNLTPAQKRVLKILFENEKARIDYYPHLSHENIRYSGIYHFIRQRNYYRLLESTLKVLVKEGLLECTHVEHRYNSDKIARMTYRLSESGQTIASQLQESDIEIVHGKRPELTEAQITEALKKNTTTGMVGRFSGNFAARPATTITSSI